MSDVSALQIPARDGSHLGVHAIGAGPEVVIVHGAMQHGLSHLDLARLLADRFRVLLVDRRGRGRSGPAPSHPDTAQEVADAHAVLDATGARRLFGVSSGAIIAARAALARADIERLALFEPPISINGSMRLDLNRRVLEALGRDDLATAMGTAMKAAEMGPPWMFNLPVPLLAALSRPLLRDETTRDLARALAADFAVVEENADRIDDFADVASPTLIINGTATRPYLREAAHRLAVTITTSTHIQLTDQNHAATQNRHDRGHPELIAQPLADFLN